LIIEGVAKSFDHFLSAHPDLADKLLDRMAELHCEVMTPAETAAMLEVTVDTLRENWRKYGLEKSTALGHNEPRFFRSQVIEAAKREGKLLTAQTPRLGKAREGMAGRITPFPRRMAPTVPTERKEASKSA
jgi:hypothetical protein